MDFQKLC